MTYQEAVAIAVERSSGLLATDFSSDSVVYVSLDDGCTFFWTSAFYEPVVGPNGVHNEYIIVYTEHYGYHLFHVSDITLLHAGTREY